MVTGATSEFVSAFDGSGAKRWATAVGGPVWHMTSLQVNGAPLIVAALKGGEVLVLSADGAIRYRGAVSARPTALTATAGDRPLIVVAEEAGTVTGFEIPRD